MTEWWQDPKLWIMAAGLAGQAGVMWWRIGAQEAADRLSSSRHDRSEAKIDSLSEWRAQVREQIRQLQNGRRDDDSE